MTDAVIKVPDIGDASDLEVIEVCVSIGEQIKPDQTLIVLESDKASMEIPAPQAGVVKAININKGDKVSEGSAIITLHIEQAGHEKEESIARPQDDCIKTSKPDLVKPAEEPSVVESLRADNITVGQYAGPAVRLMARELGVDLELIKSSGPKGRILKEDIQSYIKSALSQQTQTEISAIATVPDIDFEAFGAVEELPLSRVQKLTAQAMQRSWSNVPHVTQFDEADITDLESFRDQNRAKAEKRKLKLTPLPFLIKASAVALREHPQFNVSVSASGNSLIYKKYCHIGVAMDTPAGLMVPVIRDVDKKSIWELADEINTLSVKGKEGRLVKTDLEGGCFTVSSLGAIGGTNFTPIVNVPEVAILGVSKVQIKPVYISNTFVPRKMLPLSLSYDHRAINGVDGGQFMTFLSSLLADIRQLLM